MAELKPCRLPKDFDKQIIPRTRIENAFNFSTLHGPVVEVRWPKMAHNVSVDFAFVSCKYYMASRTRTGESLKGGASTAKRFVINVPLDGLLSDTECLVEGWRNVWKRRGTTLAVCRAIYFTSCKNTTLDHVSNTEQEDEERYNDSRSIYRHTCWWLIFIRFRREANRFAFFWIKRNFPAWSMDFRSIFNWGGS